jgi:Ras-related protein Rab-11A
LQTINVQIWDLAGQVHFSKVRTLYYKGLRGLLAVFDVTRDTSYTNLLNWISEIKAVIEDTTKIPVILIGNKIDLRIEGEPSHIASELGNKMAEQFSELLSDGKLKVNYIETSAKTGENVEAAFSKLVETIVKINS